MTHAPEKRGKLTRVLARLRIGCLIDGARVELHTAPVELLAEMGQPRPQAYTVTDDSFPALDEPVDRGYARLRVGEQTS